MIAVALASAPLLAHGQSASAGPITRAQAEQLDSEIRTLYEQEKVAEAIPLAERVLAFWEQELGPEHPDVATSLNNLAELLRTTGDYAQAEPLFRRALAIREKALGPEHPDVAQSTSNLAVLLAAKGDYLQAAQLLRRALNTWQRALGPEHPDVATALNNLAAVYRLMGYYETAAPYMRHALAIRERALGPEHPSVATSLDNLGMVLCELGDHTQAEPYMRRALAIREKALGPEHPDVATSLNNLAVLHRQQGDYTQAERFLRRALAIREKALGPQHPEVASSMSNLAMVLRDQGDYAQAERLLRRALAIREKALGPQHPDMADALNNLAELCISRGDHAQAEALHRRALAIRVKALGPQHAQVAESIGNLATLHLARGDLAEAIRLMDQSTALQDRNAADMLMTGSDEQKLAYMSTIEGYTYANVSLHLQFAPAMPQARRLAVTTILQRKGRVLDAMAVSFVAMRRRAGPEEQAKLERLRSISARYSALVWRGPGTMPADEYRSVLAGLDEERRALEDDLSRHADLLASLRPVAVEDVQAAIPEGAVLVELVRYAPLHPEAGRRDEAWGKDRYAAYVLRRGGEIAWADLGDAARIDAAVDALLPTLRRAAADPGPPARALDALVMQPVRRLLGETRWVFLSPDGKLNLVPFGALRDEDGRALVERYAFSYLSSGRELVGLGRTSPSRRSPVILAAPDFNAASGPPPSPEQAPAPATGGGGPCSFAPLAFAAEEGRALRRRLPDAELLIGADATESAVKALHGPRLLHIATHGFFMPDQEGRGGPPGSRDVMRRASRAANPLLRSGLVFAGVNRGGSGDDDGVLTALEAAQLDLDGTGLIVLSACETAVGEARSGEGVYGLRRALVIAGAEAQVMSLWKVDDAATRELMEDYYQRLLAGGGRSEALRQVQLAMLRRPDRRHPYYWASFIAAGNPAALDGRLVAPSFPRVHPGPRGCGCKVAGARGDAGAWAALLGLLAAGLRRREARRGGGAARSACSS